MSKSLEELGLEYEKEIPIIEEKLKNAKQTRKKLRKGFIISANTADKVERLEKLIRIYTEQRDELHDKARTLKSYYKKEG